MKLQSTAEIAEQLRVPQTYVLLIAEDLEMTGYSFRGLRLFNERQAGIVANFLSRIGATERAQLRRRAIRRLDKD